MYLFGFSLNVLSLMSLSLAVGLLIDDAIVVRENIFRHYEEGQALLSLRLTAQMKLCLQLLQPSTVIAVFLPVAFGRNNRKVLQRVRFNYSFAMLISVLDAFTIAPMLSAYIIPEHKEKVLKDLR